MRTLFESRFDAFELCEMELVAFGARCSLNVDRPRDCVRMEWLRLQCDLVMTEKFVALGCRICTPTYLLSDLQEMFTSLAKYT